MRFLNALTDSTVLTTTTDGDAPKREKHLYSAAKVNRVNVVTALGVLGALIAAAIVLLIPKVDPQISAWGGVATATVFSSVIFTLYEKRLWRSSIAARLPGTTVPDIRGAWKGKLEVCQSHKREPIGTPLDCKVRIEQDWSRIVIDLCTGETESWSVMATVDDDRLHYEYYVIPQSAPEGAVLGPLEPHYGMARLTLADRNTLKGDWFNDQHFHRWGKIELKRTSKVPAHWDRSGI